MQSPGMQNRVDRQSRRRWKDFLLPLLAILVFLCPSNSGVASAGVNTWTTTTG